MKLELDGLKDLLRPLQDRAAVDAALQHFTLRSGFDWVSYRSGHSSHPTSLSTLPQAWQSRYRDLDYAAVDPVLRQARSARSAFGWSSRALSPRASKAVVSFLSSARRHGIRSGFTIPIEASFGRKACLTFISKRDTLPPDLSVDPFAALSAGAFLDSFMDVLTINGPGSSISCPLTCVQLECLGWVAEGKANDDVAVLRGVTRRAVEAQLQHIRQRLDVLTTCQAVAVAVRSGWL